MSKRKQFWAALLLVGLSTAFFQLPVLPVKEVSGKKADGVEPDAKPNAGPRVKLEVIFASLDQMKCREAGLELFQSDDQQNLGGFLGRIESDEQVKSRILRAVREHKVGKLLVQICREVPTGKPSSFQSDDGTSDSERPAWRVVVLPILLDNGKIYLEADVEVNTRIDDGAAVTPAGDLLPGCDTQRVRNMVEMEDRQTLILGGLIRQVHTRTIFKVPVLGDLPFIGQNFQSVGYGTTEEESVLLVTAHRVQPEKLESKTEPKEQQE